MSERKRKVKSGAELWLVVQEGGSSHEFYPHLFDTEQDATEFCSSCDEAAYRTTPPIRIAPELAKPLLASKVAEREFTDLLDYVAECLSNL